VPRGSGRARLGRDGTSVLSLRLWSRFVDAVKAYTAADRPRAMGRGTSQGGENPREPGCHQAEKSGSGDPNRQRDQAPEARSLSAAMPHAPLRVAPMIHEGQRLRPLFDELLKTQPIVGRYSRVGLNVCLTRHGESQSQEGKSSREASTISVRSSSEGESPVSAPG